jgi:hypothetical protein
VPPINPASNYLLRKGIRGEGYDRRGTWVGVYRGVQWEGVVRIKVRIKKK